MKDGKKFREYMTGMGELFNKGSSETMSNFYWTALKPFKDNECEKAFNMAIASCKFFPKPAELIEFIVGNKKQLEQQKQDKATIEADKILSHLKTYGGSKYPEITDPVTKHLMNHRWNYKTWATQILESEIVWWKKEFINSYNSFSATEKLIENPEGRILKIVDGVGKSI